MGFSAAATHALWKQAPQPDFHSTLQDKVIYCQLVPHEMNWYKLVERFISTFKYHFIVGIFSIKLDFLMNTWDTLLDQK